MKKPEHTILNEEQIASLLERIMVCNLGATDKKCVAGILHFYLWLQLALQEATLSLGRLRTIFGFRKTEKRKHLPLVANSNEETPDGTSEEGKACDVVGQVFSQALKDAKKDEASLKEEKKKKKKGHGRLSHKDYPGATTIHQAHECLKAGDTCPEGCGGRLYSLVPKALIFLTGHALVSACRYLLERLRCSLCGKVYTASPQDGMPKQKYDEPLKANLAIAKNYAGMPFYRLQMLQNMVGVPLPHSTQWQLVESLADDIYPVYYELQRLAAQGKIINHDDTTVRILSLMAENKERAEKGEKGRTGMFTTGIVSAIEAGQTIYLFISGRCHSGENMTKLLEQRSPALGAIIRMADALSSNLSVEFINILCLCLAHGRRKFYEIYDYFPGECRIVIDALALIYHYDAIAKQEKMTHTERLLYHQIHSGHIMDLLKEWMELQIEREASGAK